MKIKASVSIKVNFSDNMSVDEGQQMAIDTLIESLEDWLIEGGVPPIIEIEYIMPDTTDEDRMYLN